MVKFNRLCLRVLKESLVPETGVLGGCFGRALTARMWNEERCNNPTAKSEHKEKHLRRRRKIDKIDLESASDFMPPAEGKLTPAREETKSRSVL